MPRKQRQNRFIERLKARPVRFELLEDRRVLAGSAWLQNPIQPLDVNEDAHVTPLDALLLVNALNKPAATETIDQLFADVSGDQSLSPLDALLVVNGLNANTQPLSAKLQQRAPISPEHPTLLTNDYGIALGIPPTSASDVWMRLDAEADDPFVPATELLKEDAFLSIEEIDGLAGSPLRDGIHRFEFRLGRSQLEFEIEIDRTPPDLSWQIAAASDSGIVGDLATSFTDIDIEGTAEPGSKIELDGRSLQTNADGHFVLRAVPLEPGENPLRVTATDPAGNQTTLEQIVRQGLPELAAIEPQEMHNGGSVHEVALEVVNGSLNDLQIESIDTPRGVAALIRNGVLELAAYPFRAEADSKSLPPVGDDFEVHIRTSSGVVQSFKLKLRGTRAELIKGVLVIDGTDHPDKIRVTEANEELVVKDHEVLVGMFPTNSVDALQISGRGGNDDIDISPLDIPSWIYGGDGKDVLRGGKNADRIFAGRGEPIPVNEGEEPRYRELDEIFGGPGNDLLYGDAGAKIIEGNEGSDHISFAARKAIASLTADERDGLDFHTDEDTDIESLDYDARVLFELRHRYRDAFGLVVNQGDGLPADINDAGIFTGIATASAALHGENDLALELIRAIHDNLWFEEHGTRMAARHPNSFLYMQGNVNPEGEIVFERVGHQPITKDGMVGIIPGIFYAYNQNDGSGAVAEAARALLKDILDYLEDTGFNTLWEFPDDWRDTEQKPTDPDKEVYRNIFERGGGRIDYKGPEGFLMSPTDMYALQNVASELGFATAHWDPLANYGPGLALLADEYGRALNEAISPVTDAVKRGVKLVLGQLKLAVPSSSYSFHVIPGVDATLVKGDISLSISEADQENVATAMAELVQAAIKLLPVPVPGGFAVGSPELLRLAEYHTRLSALSGQLIDKIVDILPDWLTVEQWIPGVEEAVAQIVPWLNGNSIAELTAFSLGNVAAAKDSIVSHLHFWTTLMMYETRPEMGDLLSPGVAQLHKSLAKANDMVLFSWLNGKQDTVDDWLQDFRTEPSYENLSYAWLGSTEDNDAKIDQSAKLVPDHYRLDYLALAGLSDEGVPRTGLDVTGDWIEHWRELIDKAARNVGDRLEQAWLELRDNLVAFAERLLSEFSFSAYELASVLWGNVTTSLPELASILWQSEATTDLSALAGILWSVDADIVAVAQAISQKTDAGLHDLASALWHGIGSSSRTDVVRGLWSVSQDMTSIARATWDQTNAGLGSIVEALWHGIGSSTRIQIASAVWNMGIGGIQMHEIARELWDETSANLAGVVEALWHGIGSSTRIQIASAVWNMGIGGIQMHEIARELWDETSANLAGVVEALWHGIASSTRTQITYAVWNMGIGGIQMHEIARELWDETNASLTSVVEALWDGIASSTRANIVGAVWNMGIGGIQLWEIASAVRSETSSSLRSLANALYFAGEGFGYATIMRAIWDTGGVSIKSAADAVYNGNVGLSFNGAVSAVMSAFNWSYLNAWKLIKSL